jgi:predicted transcriptional regulator of viral defense system
MSSGQKLKKSHVGVELVRLLASEGDRIFSTDRARELSSRVGIKDSYLWEALYHLRRNGWIVSIRRGLYAISLSVPGVNPAHEFEIAMALVNPAAISHWSAFRHHGLTDQIPRKVFVLTAAASVPRVRGAKAGGRTGDGYPVGETVYRFVQVKPERFYGTEKVWIGEVRVVITDPERTLLDGLSMPQYCGDFAEVLRAFRERGKELNLERIVNYALRLDTATAKRLGWVLENLGVDPAYIELLEQVPIKGYRKLDPTGPRKGPYNRRWMIRENLPGKVTP